MLIKMKASAEIQIFSRLTEANETNCTDCHKSNGPDDAHPFVSLRELRLEQDRDARAAFAFRCFPKTIEIPVGLRAQPLDAWSDSCRISTRLTGVLRRSGVRMLGDLHGHQVGDFARVRNCGLKTLHELDSLVGRASCSRRPVRDARASHNEAVTGGTPQNRARFAIPEPVCQLQFDELPLTKRLANVVRTIGLRTLGDLNGRSVLELLRYKACGWRMLCEIQQLIARAISGDFDEAGIDESKAAAELLTLLEQGMAKLSPREREFLLARIGGEDLGCRRQAGDDYPESFRGAPLSYAQIGMRYGLTRARVHRMVGETLETLRKTYGPRIPRLLEMVKRRCLSDPAAAGLTPALLEQWRRTETVEAGVSPASSRSFRLSRKAQVRLIAALDKSIPCCLEGRSVAGQSGSSFEYGCASSECRTAISE